MVYYYSLSTAPNFRCYVGKDKYENEELLQVGWNEDVWFHVDDYSSAHAYLRLPADLSWENISEDILQEVGHLVKLNSITGNKLSEVIVIYTPFPNLKKEANAAVGAVTFHDRSKVKKVRIQGRRKDLTNVMMKTRTEELDIRVLRQAKLDNEALQLKLAKDAAKQVRHEELVRREEEKRLAEERSYSSLMSNIEPERQVIDEDDFM
ncbi:DUF814-domain-containing protein [Perkinsela sp. CCAP 1560/4]|nr:DUF814-domain-containing protein [Perkinsela sp. CCAP 1560/4]|eukprot:KNH09509.1 DUF814-domain-containing protein [Perkinsela sp. CCAP 1560/4]